MEIGSRIINSYSECKISVFFLKDGYYFVITSKDDRGEVLSQRNIKFRVDCSYQQAFEDSLEQNPILRENFAEMDIVLDVNKYSFVPEEFFTPECSTSYYKFNHGDLSENEGVFFSYIDVANLYVVFSFDKRIIDLLENVFPQAEISPAISMFIEKIYERGKHLVNVVYANISRNVIEIAVFKSAKFMMANTFKFSSVEDAEYFLLKAYSNFRFDNSKVPLFLISDIQLPDLGNYVQIINQKNEDN